MTSTRYFKVSFIIGSFHVNSVTDVAAHLRFSSYVLYSFFLGPELGVDF